MTSDHSSRQPYDPIEPAPPAFLAEAREAGSVIALAFGPSEDVTPWARDVTVSLTRGAACHADRLFLMDLDLEDPALHDLLGFENGEGAADIFLFGASLRRVARSVDGASFYFASAGTATADPRSVLTHSRWDRLIRGFKDARATLLLFVSTASDGAADVLARADHVVVLGAGSDDAVDGEVPDDPAFAAVSGRVLLSLHPPAHAAPAHDGTSSEDGVGEVPERGGDPFGGEEVSEVVDIRDLAPDPLPDEPEDAPEVAAEDIDAAGVVDFAEAAAGAAADTAGPPASSIPFIVDIRDLAPDEPRVPVGATAPDAAGSVAAATDVSDSEAATVDERQVVDIRDLAPDPVHTGDAGGAADVGEGAAAFTGSYDAVETSGPEAEASGVEVEESDSSVDAPEEEPPAFDLDALDSLVEDPADDTDGDGSDWPEPALPDLEAEELVIGDGGEGETDTESGPDANSTDAPSDPGDGGWGGAPGPGLEAETGAEGGADEDVDSPSWEAGPLELEGEESVEATPGPDPDDAVDDPFEQGTAPVGGTGGGQVPGAPGRAGPAGSDEDDALGLVTGPDFGGSGPDEDAIWSDETEAESDGPPGKDAAPVGSGGTGPATGAEDAGDEDAAVAAEDEELAAEEALGPARGRARKDASTGRPLRLFALLLVVAVGVGVAHWFGLLRVPGLDGVLTTVLGPAATGTAPVVDETGTVPTAPAQSYSLSVDSYRDARSAADVALALAERLPERLFLVAPVQVDGAVSYVLHAGPAGTAVDADRIREPLAEVLTREDPSSWTVRSTPFAFLLDERSDLDAARSRAADLSGGDLFAYVLEVEYPDGSVGYRVYAGAYETPEEARAMRGLLAGEGLTDPRFVERRGSVPGTEAAPDTPPETAQEAPPETAQE